MLRAVVRRGGGVEGCKGVGVEGYRGAAASDRGGKGSSTCDEEGGDERGGSRRRLPGVPPQTLAGASRGRVASGGAEGSCEQEGGGNGRKKRIEPVSLIDGMVGNFMKVLPLTARKSKGGVPVAIV